MQTGFAVATRTNQILTENGLKNIPPQMVYRYMDQKLIPVTETPDGKRIADADAVAWIAKYVGKRQAKGV